MTDEIMALYQMLIANCPVDTGNMKTNIYLYDVGEYAKIKIETSYASYTNYNRQRGHKEIANYHWVEEVIKQWSLNMGGNVNDELS